MSYENFQMHVNNLISRVEGEKPAVTFRHVDGRHYANFSDGTVIIGNSVAHNVMVKWGSGHSATAAI